MREGVFMYIGSVLGSGILVIPAIAANIAGPASLVTWLLLSLLTYPMAYTFSVLASSYPDAGGLSTLVKRALGWSMGTIAGWLFFFSFLVSAPIVALIASSYVIMTIGLSSTLLYPIAFLFMTFAIMINVMGIEIGSKTEFLVLGAVLLLLFAAVALTLPHVQLNNFTPFAPKGWFAVGTVGVIIFWSFVGYENVPHMSEEFKNPTRDFQLSIALSVAVIGLLYVLTSLATIGTGIYLNRSLYAPVAVMFSRSLGTGSAPVILFLALTTSYVTLTAYSIGASRLVYALARDRSLPSFLFKLNKQAVPARALAILFMGSSAFLVLDAFLNARLDQLFLLSGAAFITLYIIGSWAAVKLLQNRGDRLRVFPYISLIVSVIVFAFVGEYVLFPLTIATSSLLWVVTKRHEQASRLGSDSPG